MKPFRKILLTTLGIASFFGTTDVLADSAGESDELLSSVQEAPWRKSRFIVEAQSGSRSVATLDAMVPFMGDDDFMIYTNLMAKMGTGPNNANGNAFEGNLGLGFRRVNDDENAIYGAYAYFDILKSVNDNQFTQVTIGAERLGLTWDFRANAYLPVGTQEYTKDIYTGGKLVISEHNLIEYIKSRTEKASAGGDIEVGRTIGSNKLRAYLAAYSFGQDLTGPRARLEYQMNDHFTFTASAQHDKERGTQYFLGARFLLGGAKTTKSNSIYSRMTDMVIRDVDIVTKTIDVDVTRVELDRFYLVDLDSGAGGDGTGEDPFGYIDDAIEAAPEGAIIFIKGEDGSINLVKDNVQLKTGQILWGGEKALYWNFDTGQPVFSAGNETLLVHDGEGVRQTIGGSIHANDNTGIYNLDITSDGKDTSGIIIDNKHNVTISAVNISGFKGSSESNPYAGIYVSGDNASVTIDDINISNSDVGVLVTGGQVSFANLTIKNSTYQGMNIKNATVTTKDLTITDSGLQGLYLENASFSADNINISTSGAEGIYQKGGSLKVSDNVTVTDSAKDGIHLEGTDLTASSLNITHSGGYGLYHNGGTSTIDSDVIVSDSEKDGIHSENVNLNAASVDVQRSGGYGVYHDGGLFNINGPLSISGSSLTGLWGSHTNFDITGNVTIDQSDSTEGSGLDLTDGSFSASGDVTVTNSKDNGLNLNDTVFNANALDITGSAKEGILANNSNVDITGDVSVEQSDSTEGSGLDLTGGSFSTSGDVTVTNSKDNGLNLNDTVFNANALDITGSAKEGILANNSNVDVTGDVSVEQNDSTEGSGLDLTGGSFSTSGDVTVTNSKDNGLNLNDAVFNANALDITGSAKEGILANNSNVDITGDVSVDQSDSTEGSGLDLTGGSFSTSGDVTVTNSKDNGLNLNDTVFNANALDITGSAKEGILANNSNVDITGDVSVEQSDSTEGSGLDLTGGSFSTSGDVTVTNSKDNGLNLNDTVFNANALDITGSAKEGILAYKSNIDITADVTVDQSDSTEGSGLDLTGGSFSASGDVTVTNSKDNGLNLNDIVFNANALDITGSAKEGILANNSNVDITADVTVDQTNAGDVNGVEIHGGTFHTGKLDVLGSAGWSVYLENVSDVSFGDVKLDPTIDAESEKAGKGLYAKDSYITEAGDVTITKSADSGLWMEGGSFFANNLNISNSEKQGILGFNTNINIMDSVSVDQTNAGDYNGVELHNSTFIANGLSVLNSEKNGVYVDGNGYLELYGVNISGSKEHGLYLKYGTAHIIDATFTNNGQPETAVDADVISKLYSAIKVGSEDGASHFNATNLTVNNNAAGIELVNGAIDISGEGARSSIDNNFGYGLWIHDEKGTLTDANRIARLSNTDISNTQKLNSAEGITGHGIYAQNSGSLDLTDVNINNNQGHGLWIQSGDLTGLEVRLSVNGTGYIDRDVSAFLVEEVDSNNATTVNMTNTTIKGNYNPEGEDSHVHTGLQFTGGTAIFNGFGSLRNNDGVLMSGGTLSFAGVNISDNKANGVNLEGGTLTIDSANHEAPSDRRDLNTYSSHISNNGGVGVNTTFDDVEYKLNIYNTAVHSNSIGGIWSYNANYNAYTSLKTVLIIYNEGGTGLWIRKGSIENVYYAHNAPPWVGYVFEAVEDKGGNEGLEWLPF